MQFKLFIIPFNKEYYFSKLGFIYFELKNDLKAVSAFEKSQSFHNGSNASISKFNWFYLGYCYLNIGYFNKAISNFECYLLFDNNNIEVLENIGRCYQYLYEWDRALEYFNKAIKMDSDSIGLKLVYSAILYELKRYAEAIQKLTEIQSYNLNSIETEFLEALKCKYNGNTKEAAELLFKVVEKIENDSSIVMKTFQIDFNLMLARFQKEANDLKGTIKTLEKTFKKQPFDLWLINDLAVEYAEQNLKLDYALRLIERPLKYQPFNSFFLDTKGLILLKMSRIEEASLLFQKSIELNPNCMDTKKHYNELATKKT